MANQKAKNLTNQHTQAAIKQDDCSIQTGIFQGPLPHPSIMEGYRRLDSSYPERIMKDFEANSEHLRYMQRTAQQAEIDKDRRAQWMAYSLTIFLLLVLVYAIYKDSYIVGGIGGLAFLGLIIKSFVAKKQGNN